ncbi:MAG: hypothetical protein GY754_43820, partial [bacterium]|nr:hypothetical protein [bacterium]
MTKENTPPERPVFVPEEAEYYPEWEDWVLLKEGDPEKQATFEFWHHSGSNSGEFEGYLNKDKDRFVLNGLNQGIYSNPDPIQSFKNLFEDGVIVGTKYFNKEDVEVDQTGKPIPERPESVHQNAKYEPHGEYWFFGPFRIINKTIRRLGTWKWWTKEGIIINEEDYGKTQEIKGKKMIYSNIDSGDLIKKRTYFKDG